MEGMPVIRVNPDKAPKSVGWYEQRIAELERLVRDMLGTRCSRSCADCPNDEDDGCAHMRRAFELGIEVER